MIIASIAMAMVQAPTYQGPEMLPMYVFCLRNRISLRLMQETYPKTIDERVKFRQEASAFCVNDSFNIFPDEDLSVAERDKWIAAVDQEMQRDFLKPEALRDRSIEEIMDTVEMSRGQVKN